MADAVDRLLRPIRTRIANLISKAVVHAVKDSTYMQLLKVSLNSDTVRDGVEHLQEYGFASNCPTNGTECIAACINGCTDNVVAIVVANSRKRKRNLQSGESAIYNGMTMDYILLKNNGTAECKALTFKCTGEVEDEKEALSKVRQRLSSVISRYNTDMSQLWTVISGLGGVLTPKKFVPIVDDTPI